MSTPADTEPLVVQNDNHHFGIICTEMNLNSQRFQGYMSDIKVPQGVWSTISCSRFDSLMFQLLVIRKKTPKVDSMLLDPPECSFISFGRGHEGHEDLALMLPELPAIRQFFLNAGVSASQLRDIESSIPSSSF